MRFQTACLAILATAQLGLAAPASGAGDSTFHRLEARENFLECWRNCKREYLEESKATKLTANQEDTCFSKCQSLPGGPCDLDDWLRNYNDDGDLKNYTSHQRTR
ncbi:hypothetical protein PspLS_06371 [Pyricularia sp. CBS 133598]|nr:hypothetical protein PspLS_06371 [Pyricularia sp. CBS 133598]